MTLHGIFAAQAARTPERIAVEDGGRAVSYGELNARAGRVARRLVAEGVQPETTVAICLERSVDLVAGILGILKAGGAYVPLDAANPVERLRYLVSDSGARAIVTRASLAPLFPNERLVLIDDDAAPGAGDADAIDPPDSALPEHLAYIIYTSGSTGRPKGVLVEHRNVVNSLRGLQAAFPAGPDDAYLFKSNHTFDASLLELFGAMWEGGRSVILRPGGERDPMAVIDAAARHGVTHLFFVTSMMQALLDVCPAAEVDTLGRLKHILVGGEAMSPRLAARLAAFGGRVRIANVYGPTETAIICAAFPIGRHVTGATVPIGEMIAGLSGRVLDESGRDVPPGAIGELHVGGESVARGYLNAPDLTRQRFVADPLCEGGRLYRTGDLCRVSDGGFLEYVERADRQIKIRGYRVELGEIETHLTTHPDLTAAVVTAAGEGGDLRLSAYYVASDPSLSVPPSALRRHLLRFLPDHMVPTAWLQMRAMPLNDNGKIDRAALPPVGAGREWAGRDGTATSRDTGDVVARVWAAELGTRAMRPDDDFFALGGHSLSAARVVIALREALGRQISVSDLYRASTLADFQRLVAKAPRAVRNAAEPGAPARGAALPLSYEQLGFWILGKLKLPFLNVIARRRVHGHIDAAALATAFERVVAGHPALRLRLGRWVPAQRVADRCRVDLVERDFSALAPAQRETAALASMDELAGRTTWDAGGPLAELRVVTLGPRLSEVQLSMPHIVSDEASGSILLNDLSRHYLGIIRREPYSLIEQQDGFETFIRDERAADRGTLRQAAAFWERYLHDVSPIVFRDADVLEPGARAGSIYLDLPSAFVDRLRSAGRDHGLGIAELLYAASLRAVLRFAAPLPRDGARPVLHVPRSSRDRAAYDGAIGLFARIDLLKIDMAGTPGLIELARRVREADLATAAAQHCPTMIKSAALNRPRWVSRDWLCRAAARAAAICMPAAGIDRELALAQVRVALMRESKTLDFAVAVNVLNSFVEEPERSLFGLPVAQTPVSPHYDPPFRRVLELYFLRDAGRHQLMLNGDLRPDLRRAIGAAVMQEIEDLHAAA